jgi:hypothetical protein
MLGHHRCFVLTAVGSVVTTYKRCPLNAKMSVRTLSALSGRWQLGQHHAKRLRRRTLAPPDLGWPPPDPEPPPHSLLASRARCLLVSIPASVTASQNLWRPKCTARKILGKVRSSRLLSSTPFESCHVPSDFEIEGRLYRCRICAGTKWTLKSNAEQHKGTDSHKDAVLLRSIPVITPFELPSASDQLQGTASSWIPGKICDPVAIILPTITHLRCE